MPRVLAIYASLTALALLTTAGGSGAARAWTVQSCAAPHRVMVVLEAGSDGHSGEVRIDLTSGDFPPDYTMTLAGSDVRVVSADDVTPVPFAVTDWRPGQREATIYVRPPVMAPYSSTIVQIYFGDTTLASASDPNAVFPEAGLRLHSRSSAEDPQDAASARKAFAAGKDRFNDVISSVTGLNNAALAGESTDFGWCISAMLEVTPETQGEWGFRYGADFGRGGHLYMADQPLDEQWEDDLWWAGSYDDPAETLEGTITLAPGWYRYEALGFEDCCDGKVGWQAQAPGGPWLDFSSSNFSIRATQCLQTTVTVSKGAVESCSGTLIAAKSIDVVSDPLGQASPLALPGSIVRYTISVTNPGRRIDENTIDLRDHLPPHLSLVVAGPSAFSFADGAVPSGLSFSWGGPGDVTDSVSFSTDGVNFDYLPVPMGPMQVDPAVTHVRIRPTGSLQPMAAGNQPSFTVSLLALVE